MAIKPICNKCKKELKKFGAILFSPPDKKGKVKKFHICENCYKSIIKRNTIYLALTNKKKFRKLADGKYTLATQDTEQALEQK